MGQQFCVFLRVSDHLEWICNKCFFTENFAYWNIRDNVINCKSLGIKIFSEKFFFCKLTPNGLKRVKNTKLLTHLPPPTNFHFRVCYTSYHTTFHQNLSINVKFFIIILGGNQFFDLKPPHDQEEANKKKFSQIGPSVPELLRDKQTHIHTYRQTKTLITL